MLLARADNTSMRYYCLSYEIVNHRKDYYDILEHTQKGGIDITEWIKWFIASLINAVKNAIGKTEHVMFKAKFWDSHTDIPT